MAIEVLFIHPGNHRKNYQELASEYTAVANPVWTLLIADYVRREGFNAAIYDVNVEGWDEASAADVISRHQPGLVVMMVYGHNPSASTQTMPAAARIAADLKKYNPDIPLALGGIHPSALPERTLHEEWIDFVIAGEGVYTVVGLIRYLSGKIDISAVPGLWYRCGAGVAANTPASVVAELDSELANYAWDLLPDLANYRAHNMHCFQDFNQSANKDFADIRSPYVTMNTSLGCPYSCHYCCINAIFGKPGIRYWSLEKVMEWLDLLVTRYNVRTIRFDDELFILSPRRVERFCDLLIERNHNLNLWVYGRVDTIRPELLRKLKRAGVNWICLGIESGNETVRNSVNKKIGREIRDVVHQIQANDIHVLGNFMFGLPEDTLATMQDTLRLATELNCEYANFYTVMGYPGSSLYDWAAGNDGHLPESWDGFSQLGYQTRPLPTKHLSAAQVLRFRDEAFFQYHANPAYLEMIDKKFGSLVTQHITKMLAISLRRQLLGQ